MSNDIVKACNDILFAARRLKNRGRTSVTEYLEYDRIEDAALRIRKIIDEGRGSVQSTDDKKSGV